MLEARWVQLESTFYQRYQAGELTRQAQRRRRVHAFLPGLPAGEEAADAAFEDYWSEYEASWRAFDDAREALVEARARGLVVGILTNGHAEDQERKMHRTHLADLGVPLIASSQLPAAKPDARAFLAACDVLEVAPERCLMVGDSVENDVEGARGASLHAVLLDRGATSEPSEGRISSLRELFRPAVRRSDTP